MNLRAWGGVFLLALLACLLAGCASVPPQAKRLEGRYRSDREATLRHWEKAKPWGKKTPKVAKTLAPILGKMEVTFKDGKCLATMEDWRDEQPVEFLSIEGDTFVVRGYSPVLERKLVYRIELDATGYWVYNDDDVLRNYSERFQRIP